MFKNGILFLFVLFSLIATQPAQAALIHGKNYLDDEQNSIYWSLLDMDLDIARLSWSDTLGSSKQTSLADVNAFIDNNSDGWRWATEDEFFAIHNWFDSDPMADGWSTAQKTGSALFFLLNGTGKAYTEQKGYDFEGYTYWQFGTKSPTGMQYVWMSDFAWDIPGVACASYSLLCQSGYFTDANSPLWLSENILQMSELNVASLLVRDHISSPSNTASSVPVPPTAWLMVLGIALILRRRNIRQ